MQKEKEEIKIESNYRKGRFSFKTVSKVLAKRGLRLYNLEGRLIYILSRGDKVNYQELIKGR